ncbi:hypothetical protein [Alicyclobacillus mengziensis]|uniref:Bacterial Ig domain-containing protein n=1 Tax=Alicyclobacillus mengziensis TaxID=2931921 RepID=A0A9X7W152_9BACL|nr:hypothetical protein [Alicyclobacillus mengziensis]QSO48836.1 hypothetical protein JZ786_07750 [Alicyclobacillus mengziensis]
MRKVKLLIYSMLVSFAVLMSGSIQAHEVLAQQRNVTDTVKFRVVSAEDFRGLSGARVIVVASDGHVVKTGLTDSQGIWSVSLTVPSDPRFNNMGVVTAVCVANGHNENVVFEVPVKQGTVQPITLYPIKPRLRNEAHASLGQLHHLDVIEIVNKYAREIGLTKQPAIAGELGYSPWGPVLKGGR